MAAPFFQGNIEDLLRVAGQGQGSYMLGQMLDRQRRAEEADISTSVLNQEAKRQEMAQSADMHPLKKQQLEQQLKTAVEEYKQKQLQTTESQNKLDIFQQSGGAAGAAGEIQTKRKTAQFDLDQKQLDAMYDEISQMDYYDTKAPLNGSYETGYKPAKSFAGDLGAVFEKYGLDLESGLARNIMSSATSPEAWNAKKEQIYLNTPKGRELKANRQMQREQAEALQRMRSETALRIAEINSKKAEAAAQAKNYVMAATYLRMAANAAIDAGDEQRAMLLHQRANEFDAKAQEMERLKAQARDAGKPDVAGATGLPKKDVPQPTPFPAPTANPTQSPQSVPTPVIEWETDPVTKKLRRKQ